jgi:D-alanyl-D-alanine carboxypeptidase
MKNHLIVLIFVGSTLVAKAQSAADSMLQMFQQNKKNAAIFAVRNDGAVIAYNENATMPIGTMSDLLVAIEFAKQSAYKIVDTAERVSLKEIVKYNIENPFQPEYESWLTHLLETQKIKDNTVSLLDVVHGMLQFGVQANTEYLMDRVGFDNVKSSIVSYNLANHTTIVLPMGSLALYQNRSGTSEKKMLKAINAMSDDNYHAASYLMHVAMKGDSTFKIKMPKNFVNEKVMNAWSYNLAQGSVKSYGSLLQTIVKEKMLDAKFYKMLRKVLEWPMQYETVNTKFTRFMMKGSSTINTFSQAQYGKFQDGKEMILVYTISGLKPNDKKQLINWHQQFETQVFNDNTFLEKMKNTLKSTPPLK